jgi:DNA-directed RNA polymerase specialized sigma24 family protein
MHELTADALEALLRRLGPDRDQAAVAYEQIRRRVVRLFEYRGCPDAEALADETMSRVGRRLAGGVEIRAADPYAYFAGVAGIVYREVVRQEQNERSALRALPAPAPVDLDPRLACLDRCLDGLPATNRALVLDYHATEGQERIRDRARLAEERGIDLNALRVRVHRLRQELEACVARCLGKGSGPGDTEQ